MIDKGTIESIEKLLNLSREKLEKGIEISTDEHIKLHFKKVSYEVNEAKKQFRKNNVIFLEDELTGIFWDYILLLSLMERDGYIRSMDNVFNRALEKHTEVCDHLFSVDKGKSSEGVKEWIVEEIEKKQNAELRKQHDKLYNKKNYESRD